jgi:hypothetical protein
MHKDGLPVSSVEEFERVGFTFIKNISDGVLPDWYQTSIQTEAFLSRTCHQVSR